MGLHELFARYSKWTPTFSHSSLVVIIAIHKSFSVLINDFQNGRITSKWHLPHLSVFEYSDLVDIEVVAVIIL